MRPILITGATGFIGGRLAGRLTQAGREVHVVVRSGSGRDRVPGSVSPDRVHLHDGGMASVERILARARPETVYHLAAAVITRHRPADVEAIVQANLLFGIQLAEACAQANVRRLINAGTVWQHVNGQVYAPGNLYAATKQAFEDILVYYIHRGLQHITLKPSQVYGPGQPRSGVLRQLWDAGRSATALPMSAPDKVVNVVFIDDVVDAFVRAERVLDDPASVGRWYTIMGPGYVSLQDLVLAFERVTGVKVAIQWGAVREGPERPDAWEGPRLPGWWPEVGLEEGLSRLVKSWQGE